MGAYQKTEDVNTIRRTRDGLFIAVDPNNRDYQKYLKDVEAGEVLDPYVPPPADTRRNDLRSDTDAVDLMTQLQGSSPAQIRSYVNSNVNNIADAKQMLVKILLILASEK